MYYTDEQAEKIFANLDTIVAYIKDEIMPLIPEHETVQAKITFEYGRSWGIYVTNSNISGYFGMTDVHFNKGEKFCIYDYPNWAAEYVLNWKEIKKQLHEEVNKLRVAYETAAYVIDNFEV